MRKEIILSSKALVLIFGLSQCLGGPRPGALVHAASESGMNAQTSANNAFTGAHQRTAESSTAPKPRPRMRYLRVADFHLIKDDRLVYGKLLSEDKTRITLEEPDKSKIVVNTYDKKEIDLRTLHTRNVPEARYYLELAEYFAGRTWDFTDDPDDFIQALRCYERAGQSIAEIYGQESERLNEIEEEIKRLKADRQVWTREVQSRAKLKELEFEAQIEKRLKELEDKVEASVQQVNRTAEQVSENYQTLERAVSDLAEDASRQLQILEDHILLNKRALDDLLRTTYYYPRYHYHSYYYPRVRVDDDRQP